jgi:hypothetical protein
VTSSNILLHFLLRQLSFSENLHVFVLVADDGAVFLQVSQAEDFLVPILHESILSFLDVQFFDEGHVKCCWFVFDLFNERDESTMGDVRGGD